MFRELSQKKNIITLVLTVWLCIAYLTLPIIALTLEDEQPIETLESTVETVVESKEETIVEQIEEDVLNSEVEVEVEAQEEPKVEEPKVEEPKQEPIPEPIPDQTTVESEVIDEYFDDAQVIGEYAVPSINTNFKSYTNYTLLSKRSIQWKLQERAYTDENGLRKIGNYYLAAMGSYYSTTIGDKFRLTTDTGAVFDIMLCDGKSDRHTDSRHMYTTANNCMVEFYVDTTKLNRKAKRAGSLGVLPEFSGSIVKVESLGSYEW